MGGAWQGVQDALLIASVQLRPVRLTAGRQQRFKRRGLPCTIKDGDGGRVNAQTASKAPTTASKPNDIAAATQKRPRPAGATTDEGGMPPADHQ